MDGKGGADRHLEDREHGLALVEKRAESVWEADLPRLSQM